MFKNYIKIAWRNLQSRKGYTVINITGLAIGLAACMLIGLYVQDELSYDDFHNNADRTYRVLREFDIPDLKTTIPTTPSALAPALEENLTAVENAVRVIQANPVVEYGTKKFVENSFIATEAGFFEIFSFPIVRGEASLEQPFTLLITKAMSEKYFAGDDPVGKTLRIGSSDYEVTGILADIPENSHLKFGFVASMANTSPDWGRNNFITYVMLREGITTESTLHQISNVIKASTDPQDEQAGDAFIPHLQPITGIHLGQGVSVSIGSQGNILYVYLFIALAVFIILLACINYMNLATAHSAERAREVGMRKTLGASRIQIAAQFLGESVMMTAFAMIMALALCQVMLPFINDLAGKSVELSSFYNLQAVFLLMGSVFLIGSIAGFYPAIVLSSFEPSRAVKGAGDAAGGNFLRKGLVVFQFAISISLLIATGVVYQQLQYMKSSGLGFDAEDVVVIEQVNFLGDRVETFKQEISKIPGVEEVASGFSLPGTFFINSMWQTAGTTNKPQNLDYTFVDYNYIETLGIELLAGRSLSPDYSTDSTAAILNEAAVRDFGWTPQEAIGKELTQGQRRFRIVGVAKNFHYRSLHAKIYSLALFGPQRSPRYVAARLQSETVPDLLEELQGKWKEFSELPFDYSFLADDLAMQYRSEDRLVRVFGVFAATAILIGCMGLFGLAAFVASRRTKEIGIRKVLGATITGIIGLLSRDFLGLVLLGFLFAVPLAWYAMSRWLENFAYKIEMSPDIFLLAGGLAVIIALFTVSWQAIKAALINPVESLRSE